MLFFVFFVTIIIEVVVMNSAANKKEFFYVVVLILTFIYTHILIIELLFLGIIAQLFPIFKPKESL